MVKEIHKMSPQSRCLPFETHDAMKQSKLKAKINNWQKTHAGKLGTALQKQVCTDWSKHVE